MLNILILFYIFFLFFKPIGKSTAEPTFASPNHIGLNSFNPGLSATAQERFAYILVYETLLEISPRNTLKPGIAKSWEVNRKQGTIDFTIDSGHYFSDGSKVTIKDILNTFNTLCDPKSITKKYLEEIVGCGTDSRNSSISETSQGKLRLKISANPTQFLHKLTNLQNPIFKLAKSQYLGSGKYQISHISKEKVSFSRNPWYPKKNGQLENFSIVHIEESEIVNSLNLNYLAGALSYIQGSFRNFNNPGYQISFDKKLVTQTLFFNNQVPPLNNQELRRSVLNQVQLSQKSGKISTEGETIRGFIPRGLGGSIAGVPTPVEPEKPIYRIPKRHQIKIHQHIVPVLMSIFNHSNQRQTLDYLGINEEEIIEAYRHVI